MKFRNLGSSGLKVSVIGLGANNFGWWVDESTSTLVIERALELGVNYIDTADMYDKGRSEEFVGKALKGRRDKVLVATKCGHEMGEGPNERGGSRYYILKAVERSLKRLNTDYIDLYQLHHPDPTTPFEETLRVMDDLVRSGKVRYIGCSNFLAWQLSDAFWTSVVHHLNGFITVQVKYNFLERQIEKELVPCCQAHGIGIVPWGPLAGGFLTGKYQRGEKAAPPGPGARGPKVHLPLYRGIFNDANWERVQKLDEYAKARGHDAGEAALAWLISRPWVSTVIAGATSAEQVQKNVSSADWNLTTDELAELDKIYAMGRDGETGRG